MVASPAAAEARARRMQQLKDRRQRSNVAPTTPNRGGEEGAELIAGGFECASINEEAEACR